MAQKHTEEADEPRHLLSADYWDALAKRLVIKFPNNPDMYVIQGGKLPPGLECLVVERDRQYGLIGQLEGKDRMDAVAEYVREWKTKNQELPIGTILPQDLPLRISIFAGHWELQNFHIITTSVSAELVAGLAITKYKIGFHLDSISYCGESTFYLDEKITNAKQSSVVRNYKFFDIQAASDEPRLYIDWFLNAPDDHFPRPSEAIFYEDFILKDDDWKKTPTNFRRRRVSGGRGFKHSFFRFTYHQYKVKVRKIGLDDEDKLSPNWSKKLAIEYHCKTDETPTKEQRETVAEFVSFLVGRHLLRVGSSCFLRNDKIAFEAISPWGQDVISICTSVEDKPIELGTGHAEIEKLIDRLLPAYEQQRKSIQVNELIWALWIAKRMPTSLDLPIYASALESISITFLRKQGWTAKKDFLTNAEKEAMVNALNPLLNKNHYQGDIIDQIKKMTSSGINEKMRRLVIRCVKPIVSKNKYREIIINKINTIRDISIGERLRIFFAEINLPLGNAEESAMKARNDVIHRMSLLDSDSDEIMRHGSTYRALVHRVILRLLGYTGEYIDYSELGLPSKPIGKAQGS